MLRRNFFRMKFYDLEWLAKKCGTDNKYEITAKIAAEARRESEEATQKDKEKNDDKENPVNELFISKVLLEIENDTSPISVNYTPPQFLPTKEEIEQAAEAKSEEENRISNENEAELNEINTEEEEDEEENENEEDETQETSDE